MPLPTSQMRRIVSERVDHEWNSVPLRMATAACSASSWATMVSRAPKLCVPPFLLCTCRMPSSFPGW
eukprot:scaffold41165_cov32-Prasinocladus_malaysianus.AAC.3